MPHYGDDSLKVKRYGQVFSGKRVGELLVSLLPANLSIKTIIDPMVGQGDLLRAAYMKFPQAEKITGIDIDADVIKSCKGNIPDAHVIRGDAFKSEDINITQGWDLVITNPPYVRYQTLKSNSEVGLPDGKELRKNLIKHIQQSVVLSDSEKQLYLDIAKRYSGLSDMSVPSFFLCASIVKQGGYMAMVVPETWLNRDYALPIQYLLLRCFDIIVIAKDTESSWFDNTEIKTCLVISRRKKNKPLAKCCAKTIFLEMGAGIINSDSLVGKMKYHDNVGYDALSKILFLGTSFVGEGFQARTVPSLELFSRLMSELSGQKWVREEDRLHIRETQCLPNEIGVLVARFTDVKYESLSVLGWSIGQGLRTGANDFFYVQVISEEGSALLAQTEDWYGKNIRIGVDNFKKAYKKRNDVEGLVVAYDELKKCIIYVQDQVRNKDYQRISHKAAMKFSVMDSDLDDYISEGEKYISPLHKRPFKELSAVITNEKKTDSGFERFWYMLPVLKERHMPNLCMPRVCGGSPEVIFVNQSIVKEIVVDANFITLWNQDPFARMRAFAFLNSTWAKTFLEVSGTAMGGGALKIEASHMRKIMFPKLGHESEKMLEGLGRRILKDGNITEDLQNQIDEVVLSPFGADSLLIKKQLDGLCAKKMQERTGRKKHE